MDNYDVVIEKTVRDLFKSTKLNQIKKLKNLKDAEIQKKDENLRDLILERYPILIQSISALEKISLNVSDLHSIRKNLGVNVNKFQNNFEFFKFSIADRLNKNFDEKMSKEEEIENIQQEIERCVNLLHENKFDSLLITMIGLKNKILKSDNNLYKSNDLNFLRDDYEFILVDYIEILMKKFLEKKINVPVPHIENKSDLSQKQSSSGNRNNYDEWNLEKFFLHFFGVFHLIFDKEKFRLSQLYLKLHADKNIKNLYESIFYSQDVKFMHSYAEFSVNINSAIECIIKILLLKLSQFLRPGNKNHYLQIVFNSFIFISLIEGIRNLYKIKGDSFDDVNSEEEILYSDSDSDEFLENKKFDENDLDVNIKSILKKVSLIFSINCDFKILIGNERNSHSDGLNYIHDNFKNYVKNFLSLIKNQVQEMMTVVVSNKNIKDKDISHLILNSDDSLLEQIYDSYNKFYSIFKQISENSQEDKEKFLMFKYVNKIIFEMEPQILNTLKDSNTIEYEYSDDPFLLFNFLFLESTSKHIQKILAIEFDKIKFENFENSEKGNYDCLKIYEIFREISKFNNSSSQEVNVLFTKTIKNIVSKSLEEFLSESIRIIKTQSKSATYSKFINFQVKSFCNRKFKNYMKNMEFHNYPELIGTISNMFMQNQLYEVQLYMEVYKNHLFLEYYLDEECYDQDQEFTNCFEELALYLPKNFGLNEIDDNYQIEMSEMVDMQKIKCEIFKIITNNYSEVLKEVMGHEKVLLNKRIKNDIFTIIRTFITIKNEMNQEIQNFDENIIQDKKFLSCLLGNSNSNDFDTEYSDTLAKDFKLYENFMNFFYFPKDKIINDTSINNTISSLSLSMKSLTPMTKSFESNGKYQLDSLPPQLNPFLLKKNQRSKEEQAKKATTNIGNNSISKLLVLSIDSNYMSLKASGNSQQTNVTSSSNQSKNSQVNLNKPQSQAQFQGNKTIQEGRNENNSTALSKDSSGNIKGYLGYFGGMLKDLSGLTGYKTNLTNEMQQNLK